MPAPLLPALIGLTGLFAGSTVSNELSNYYEQRRSERMQNRLNRLSDGLDLTNPQDFAQYASNQAQDVYYGNQGNNLLQKIFAQQAALNQNQSQFDTTFNNLSAYQQAQLNAQSVKDSNLDTFKNRRALGKDFIAAINPFRQVRTQANIIESLVNNENKTVTENDLLRLDAAIKSFAKLTDPTTGVMGKEGDNVASAAAGGAIDSLRLQISKLTKGQGINDDVRRSFLSATQDIVNAYMPAYTRQVNLYKDLAAAENIDLSVYMDNFGNFKPVDFLLQQNPGAPVLPTTSEAGKTITLPNGEVLEVLEVY